LSTSNNEILKDKRKKLHEELERNYGTKYKSLGKQYVEVSHNNFQLSVTVKPVSKRHEEFQLKIQFCTITAGKTIRVTEKGKSWETFLEKVILTIDNELKLREHKMISQIKKDKIDELNTMTIKAFTGKHIDTELFGINEFSNGININFNKNNVSVTRPAKMKWTDEKKFRCMANMTFTNEEYELFLNFIKGLKDGK
jgi:hypothetical protein